MWYIDLYCYLLSVISNSRSNGYSMNIEFIVNGCDTNFDSLPLFMQVAQDNAYVSFVCVQFVVDNVAISQCCCLCGSSDETNKM